LEEVSPPIPLAAALGRELGDHDERRGMDENMPLDGHHHHRSGTVVLSLGKKNHISMPVLMSDSATNDPEDDRTPTIRPSFWGKE
jgi:hypothetical protein